ncbi:MAG: hypothetical protein E7561_04975 [Ruminococcaceae bacterium]|nr:hypothetical protein [Oscillospiraceae bacterium]
MNFLNLFFMASKAQNGLDIKFEPGKFVDMLGYMGKGMLVIFVIIGVIILATAFINKIFSNKK